MTEQTTGGAITGAAPAAGMTNAEKLVALQTYNKALKPMEEHLRAATLTDMQDARAERVGAYLPGGEKIGTVGVNAGRKTARVTDARAALLWAMNKYPDEITRIVNPAFLKALTDYAALFAEAGEPGVDPKDGELLDFIQVQQGAPYVTVTTTKEGVAHMTKLAHGFAGMLETPAKRTPAYDSDFADRLENGAYGQ